MNARRIAKEAAEFCRHESVIIGDRTKEHTIVMQRFMRTPNGQVQEKRKRTLCGRSINLRQQVEQSLSKLKSLGFHRENLGIEMWLDGSSVCRYPMVMVCWKFLFDKSFFDVPEAVLCELRKTQICTLVPGTEDYKELTIVFRDHLCPQIRELEKSAIGDTTVQLKLFLCDNKAMAQSEIRQVATSEQPDPIAYG